MADTISITLPDTPEKRKQVLLTLVESGCITEKEGRDLGVPATRKRGRWAQAAQRLATENHLKGQSRRVEELFAEFREDFEL